MSCHQPIQKNINFFKVVLNSLFYWDAWVAQGVKSDSLISDQVMISESWESSTMSGSRLSDFKIKMKINFKIFPLPLPLPPAYALSPSLKTNTKMPDHTYKAPLSILSIMSQSIF